MQAASPSSRSGSSGPIGGGSLSRSQPAASAAKIAPSSGRPRFGKTSRRTSGGIQTIGNLPGSYYGISAFNVGNAALPDEGASIRVRAGMAKTVDVDAFAERHLAEVKQKIAQLRALQGELSRMTAECAGGRVSACKVIEALHDHPASL